MRVPRQRSSGSPLSTKKLRTTRTLHPELRLVSTPQNNGRGCASTPRLAFGRIRNFSASPTFPVHNASWEIRSARIAIGPRPRIQPSALKRAPNNLSSARIAGDGEVRRVSYFGAHRTECLPNGRSNDSRVFTKPSWTPRDFCAFRQNSPRLTPKMTPPATTSQRFYSYSVVIQKRQPRWPLSFLQSTRKAPASRPRTRSLCIRPDAAQRPLCCWKNSRRHNFANRR